MKSLRSLPRAPSTLIGRSRCCHQCLAKVTTRSRIAAQSRHFSSKTDESTRSNSHVPGEEKGGNGTADTLHPPEASADPKGDGEVKLSAQGNETTKSRLSKYQRTRWDLVTVTSDKFPELMRPIPRPVVVVTSLEVPMEGQYKKGRLPRMLEDDTAPPPRPMLQWKQLDEYVEPVPRAMTVSSFASLTMDPKPTVMFSVNLPSHTFAAIQGSRRFNVHVLLDDERGAQLADCFSRGDSQIVHKPAWNLLFKPYTKAWQRWWSEQAKNRAKNNRPYTPYPREAVPALEHKGVAYVMRCVVKKSGKSTVGGHGIVKAGKNTVIIIGHVVDVVKPAGLERDPLEYVTLSYAQQKYWGVGRTITPLIHHHRIKPKE